MFKVILIEQACLALDSGLSRSADYKYMYITLQ